MVFFKNEDEGGERPTPGATVLPLLPLRDIVVFPHMVVPLFVGRARSIAALEDAVAKDRQLLLVAQRQASQDDPGPDDVFEIGTVGSIIQLLRLPDGTVKVLVEGKQRARIEGFVSDDPFFACETALIADQDQPGAQPDALVRSLKAGFEKYVKLNKKVPPEILNSVTQINEPARLAATVSARRLGSSMPDSEARISGGTFLLSLTYCSNWARTDRLRTSRRPSRRR